MKRLFLFLKSGIVKLCTNKSGRVSLFRIAILVFVLFIVLFDENSLVQGLWYDKEIKQLQREVEHYTEIAEESKRKMAELETNVENLEYFAREHYYMKRPEEDLYVIE